MHSSLQGADGLTRVLSMAPKEQSRGESLTPNISEWPNDAVVCSLSQVLEQTSIPQQFFLSSKACAGILRRAEKRGKQLPEPLRLALQAVAGATPENGGNSTQFMEEVAPCLTGADKHGVAQPMAFAQNTRDEVRYINGDGAIAGALAAESGMKQTNYVHQAMAVRRLTPTECERLQGFPDEYTNIPWRKQPESPDGPRYKALGNSWAVPVIRWIGERIERSLG
jgi:site-specific DNA-cytosine methylase